LLPDRAIFATKNYIVQFLAASFTEYPTGSLDNVAIEAGNKSPVIFLVSADSDPTPLIEEAARRAKKELSTVSMGQALEEFAENFINHSKAKSERVLRQNCHLGLRYMETLFDLTKQTH
jgi:dynein heavy chain